MEAVLSSWSDGMAHLRSVEGQKLLRYSAASVLSVVMSVALLVLFYGPLRLGAVWSSTLATAVTTIPSYQLNRRWAWGKSGRGHLWREVVPFWVLAFIGWAFSTYSVKLTESALRSDHSMAHFEKTAIVALVYLGAFGVLWIAKFIIFNKVMFVHRPHDLSTEAVDALRG